MGRGDDIARLTFIPPVHDFLSVFSSCSCRKGSLSPKSDIYFTVSTCVIILKDVPSYLCFSTLIDI